MVLGEYGGDTEKPRKEYKRRIYAEVAQNTEIKESIVGRRGYSSAFFFRNAM